MSSTFSLSKQNLKIIKDLEKENPKINHLLDEYIKNHNEDNYNKLIYEINETIYRINEFCGKNILDIIKK